MTNLSDTEDKFEENGLGLKRFVESAAEAFIDRHRKRLEALLFYQFEISSAKSRTPTPVAPLGQS